MCVDSNDIINVKNHSYYLKDLLNLLSHSFVSTHMNTSFQYQSIPRVIITYSFGIRDQIKN